MRGKNDGFTLLEMTLVLTIIGLLVGAILVGMTLMKSAELQRAISDEDGYIKAVQSFREKYHDFPGDLPTAEALWGSDAACPATPYSATPTTLTCNGNGNTHIGDPYYDSGATNYEVFRAWQQLSDAMFVKLTFSGVSGAGGSLEATPGINVPAAPIQGGGYSIVYIQPQDFSASTTFFPASYGHILLLGGFLAGDLTKAPLLTPQDAYLIDTKVDDGLPAYGKVVTTKSGVTPNCTTSDTPAASGYNATYQGIACNLIFITGF